MKVLLLLRHAKSILKSPNLSDHDRPLDVPARQDALQVGKLLRYKKLVPEYIVSSTALRAKSTADLLAEGCGYAGEVVLEQTLYQANPKDYIKVLERLPDRYQRVLLVGHNPAIEDTIEMFISSTDVVMHPSTLAHIDLPIRKWSELYKENDFRGKLIEVLSP